MTKFLAYTFLAAVGVAFTYLHFHYGWGLTVQSWPAVIGFGLVGPMALLTLRAAMGEK